MEWDRDLDHEGGREDKWNLEIEMRHIPRHCSTSSSDLRLSFFWYSTGERTITMVIVTNTFFRPQVRKRVGFHFGKSRRYFRCLSHLVMKAASAIQDSRYAYSTLASSTSIYRNPQEAEALSTHTQRIRSWCNPQVSEPCLSLMAV